jgi:hypothetical protein
VWAPTSNLETSNNLKSCPLEYSSTSINRWTLTSYYMQFLY